MAKITINPSTFNKNDGPKGEHITRIMYDDNEPPKNYIWGKPDGYFYTWNGIKWVKLNENPNIVVPDFPGTEPNTSKYITKTDLDLRLKQVKTEIVSYLTKLINAKSCNGDGSAAVEWVTDNIIPQLRLLQEIDHSVFATKQELLDAIGNIDFDDLATKQELLDAISGVASSQAIINLNTALTNLTNTVQNNERVTSAALNDLNDRMEDFVTAEVVNDISSIQL